MKPFEEAARTWKIWFYVDYQVRCTFLSCSKTTKSVKAWHFMKEVNTV